MMHSRMTFVHTKFGLMKISSAGWCSLYCMEVRKYLKLMFIDIDRMGIEVVKATV